MESLRNQFLIAMPSIKDSTFSRSVTYICEHSPSGSMGLIINMPSPLELGSIYHQLDLNCNNNSGRQDVLTGGPVQTDRGFILHPSATNRKWESTLNISKEICLTTSLDIIESLADGTGPDYFLPILGYAGWEGGQLEQEIADNDWLTAPSNIDILFHKPLAERWTLAAKLLGIDIHNLSNCVGHG